LLPKIILASQSPRRSELLSKMGVEFTIQPSSFDEKLDEQKEAAQVAQELALGKAEAVAEQFPDAYVIGSDTVVAVNGRQMEKPRDIYDAREMLTALAGKESTVSSGIAIINKSLGIQLSQVDITKVYFYADDDGITQKREAYLASGDWSDKAGGYGIQSGAAPIIQCIDGHYDTIVGLPTNLLAEMLSGLGITAAPVNGESPVTQK
jgi:septum formation protein